MSGVIAHFQAVEEFRTRRRLFKDDANRHTDKCGHGKMSEPKRALILRLTVEHTVPRMRTSHAYGACRLVLRYSRLLPRLTCDRLSRNSFKTISQVFGVRRKTLIFISDVDKVISALQNCWKVSSGLLEFN